jgi:hypothetical protein
MPRHPRITREEEAEPRRRFKPATSGRWKNLYIHQANNNHLKAVDEEDRRVRLRIPPGGENLPLDGP